MKGFEAYTGGVKAGIEAKQGKLLAQQMGMQIQNDLTIADLTKKYVQEPNQQTLQEIAALDPQKAQGLMEVQKAYIQDKAQNFIGGYHTYKSASDTQKNALYPKIIKGYQKAGIDVSNVPLERTKDNAQEVDQFFEQGFNSASVVLGIKPYEAKSTVGQIEQDYRRGGLSEENYRAGMRKATEISAPQTQIIMGSERAEQQELGKIRAKKYESVQEKASMAESQNQILDTMSEAFQDPDAYFGIGAEAVTKAKQLGEAIGLDTKGLKAEGIVQAFGNRLAMQIRNPKGDEGLTGSTSDKDLAFLKNSVPSNIKTKEQNLALIDIIKEVNNKKIELAQFQEQYLEDNGSLKGFEQARKKYLDIHPVFSQKKKEEYKERLSGKTQEKIPDVQKKVTITREQAINELKRRGVI